MQITRQESDDTNVATIDVPLQYSPKEKLLARVIGNPELINPDTGQANSKPIAITLPRMGFQISGIAYDPNRKLKSTNKRIVQQNNQTIAFQYSPVPYNIGYSLSILTKNTTDGTRIIEQILPFFTPAWQIKAELIAETQQDFDIPIILHSVNYEERYEGPFPERKTIIWDLNFVLKGWIWGPIREIPLIKEVIVNFKIPANGISISNAIGVTTTSEQLTIFPGLTANGQPTSNASLTINYQEIQPNDNYGWIFELDSDNILSKSFWPANTILANTETQADLF